VSSAAMSPDFGCGLAFAMLERGHWQEDTEVTVATPAGAMPARVTALPFRRA
ncbi:MAG: hypothetical protein JNL25_06955, partial [Rhodospirillaceae bacterium]|nr:hypothetical protein [Rhodospirillaceae bacterium]